MADSVCAIILVACVDVCAGVCYEWTTIRQSWTEDLCNCCRCSCCEDPADEEETEREREPLLKGKSSRDEQPPAQPPMDTRP
uniref:Uncharacterized protein n=1 Tax=Mycena chlorophos TaxID=658473 RepID=A0ABQ0M363_MYCCL|nr:predicted protein [Mycena chlorophos]